MDSTDKSTTLSSNVSKEEAWNYALGMIKIDGLEPSEEFKQYVAQEKANQITTKDIKKLLDKKYKMKDASDE